MRKAALGFLAVLALAAAWFGYQAFHVYSAVTETTGIIVPTMTDEPTVTVPPLDGTKRINVLVLGSDNDKKKEEQRPLSQSMIIVSIDPVHYRVSMISIPRDFWVPIPGHGYGKIDLAYKYGGVGLARDVVERLFGVPIHFYAWVGLQGFVKVIDTFNGATVDVPQPILDDSYPNDLNSTDVYGYRRVFIPAGWQHMDGTHALQYVRSRHGDYFGDFGRSHRQQEILLQLDHKVNAMNIALHLPQLVDALKESVRTDFTLPEIYQLEEWSHHITQGNVTQYVLQPPTYSKFGFSRDGQSIVVPSWRTIRPLVQSLLAPLHVTPTPMPTARPTTQPRQIAAVSPRPTISSTVAAPATPATAVPTATRVPTPAPTWTPSPTPAPANLNTGALHARLFYVRGGNIFELLRDGSMRQLTYTGDASMPKPSPDGGWLAYVRFFRDENASDLWLLNLRTRRAHAVTHPQNTKDVRNNLWAAWPTWAPSGKTIYFSWDKQKLGQPPADIRSTALALWSIGTNGSRATKITSPTVGASGDTEPVVRPGTGQIAYVKWNYWPDSFQPYSQLVLFNPATQVSWYLTSRGGRVIQPAWNNNGSKIVFVRLTNGVDEIAEAPVAKSHGAWQLGVRKVLARGQIAQPAFTPDGKWVTYLRVDGNGFDMYAIRSTGGSTYKLGQVPADIDARWHPFWMP